MLRYCGIMAPNVEGAVTRARDSARPAAGFPRRHALGVSINAVHGRSCSPWAAALPWLPLQYGYRTGSLDWQCARFIKWRHETYGVRRGDELFEMHNNR